MSDLTVISPLTYLNEDEKFFFDTVKDFAVEKIKPYVMEMDRDASMRAEIPKQFFEMGLMGIHVPEEYGGAETNFFMSTLAIEALASVDGSAAVIVDVQNTLVNNCFMNWANDAMKKKYLPQLTSEKIGAYALSEAASGSDAFALECKAEDKGDHWILNGQKLWITNAAEAEIFIVFVMPILLLVIRGLRLLLWKKTLRAFLLEKKRTNLASGLPRPVN